MLSRCLRQGWVFAFAILAGCAAKPQPPVAEALPEVEPVGLQMLRTEAQLSNYPYFTLLGFERDSDPVFVRAEGAEAAADSARSHTGSQSLRLDPGTKNATVKLSSLHSGRPWPGNWTLVGAYFFSPQPQRLTAVYEEAGRSLASYTVEVPANAWTPVLLDITPLQGQAKGAAGVLRFTFPAPTSQPLWIDDVVEMDNTAVHVNTPHFIVREKGFSCTIEAPGSYKVMLKTPEASEQGWKLEEANLIRARFSSAGRHKSMVVCAGGRQIIDGKAVALSSRHRQTIAQQHDNPAQITLNSEVGRVDRNSAGDQNNDGYNELTGTYRLIAAGPRMAMLITPQPVGLTGAVLEIAEFPPGKVLATMEGQLVDRIVRLDDGRVLIELPGTLDRPTMLNVRVSQ
jgi:hypothetical protein